MPLGDPGRLGGFGELSRELRAIIVKCVLDTHRQHRLCEIKGLGCPETWPGTARAKPTREHSSCAETR